ncbi:MAG: hypothetical protein DMG08_12270 [Acidobacteria bacterium]|nr:MAG: hypothetical protein DMG08_12270 [Acidobacteriota bacterium]PYV36175.1 MAG: hypothetical protein DMG09_18240 [Acidobacteriota bacterium]
MRIVDFGFRIADCGLNNLTISIADIGIYSGNLNSRLDCSIRNPQSEIGNPKLKEQRVKIP